MAITGQQQALKLELDTPILALLCRIDPSRERCLWATCKFESSFLACSSLSSSLRCHSTNTRGFLIIDHRYVEISRCASRYRILLLGISSQLRNDRLFSYHEHCGRINKALGVGVGVDVDEETTLATIAMPVEEPAHTEEVLILPASP